MTLKDELSDNAFFSRCQAYGESLTVLLEAILGFANIQVHTVSFRVKSRESLLGKIKRKAKYASLADITDILGLRIVTYFNDDVDKVAQVLEREFVVDRSNSEDKRLRLGRDRFGYASVHLIVTLGEARSQLPEYARFSTIQFEIQVRSILQHTWAEIEHDLGYKGRSASPSEIARSFSRLASLLELADAEFVRVRDTLQDYRGAIERSILENDLSFDLDATFFAGYIESSPVVARIDNAIAAGAGLTLRPEPPPDEWLKGLRAVGYKTIEEVDADLKKYEGAVVELAVLQRTGRFAAPRPEHWVNPDDLDPGSASHGVSLFYLLLLQLSQGYNSMYADPHEMPFEYILGSDLTGKALQLKGEIDAADAQDPH